MRVGSFAFFSPICAVALPTSLQTLRKAFRGADKLILVEIYQPTGREDPLTLSSADLANAIERPSDPRYAATLSDALAQVTQLAEPEDLVIVMGAGDITELCDPLLEYLHSRTAMEYPS